MTKNKNLYQPVKRLRKDVVLRKDESKMNTKMQVGMYCQNMSVITVLT